jgi:hypothetical protein
MRQRADAPRLVMMLRVVCSSHARVSLRGLSAATGTGLKYILDGESELPRFASNPKDGTPACLNVHDPRREHSVLRDGVPRPPEVG